MDLKKKLENIAIWNSWWLKPFLLLSLITIFFSNLYFLTSFRGETSNYINFGIWILVYVAIIIWAAIRKAKETEDYKKIFLSGYLFGTFIAIIINYKISDQFCKIVMGMPDCTPFKIMFGNLNLFVLWTLVIPGIIIGLIFVLSAKFLKKKG